MRNGERLILVLNGLRYPDLEREGPRRRDWFVEQRRGEEAARLLEMAYREFRPYSIYKANQTVGQVQVSGGTEDTVPAIVKSNVAPIMEVDSRSGVKVALHYNTLTAPVSEGQPVGTLTVTAPDFPGMNVTVYAAKAVPETGFFGKVVGKIESLIWRKKGG